MCPFSALPSDVLHNSVYPYMAIICHNHHWHRKDEVDVFSQTQEAITLVENVGVKQRLGTNAIRTKILPSKPKWETKLNNKLIVPTIAKPIVTHL